MQQQKQKNDLLNQVKKEYAKKAQLKKINLMDRARRRAIYGNSLLGNRFLGNDIF